MQRQYNKLTSAKDVSLLKANTKAPPRPEIALGKLHRRRAEGVRGYIAYAPPSRTQFNKARSGSKGAGKREDVSRQINKYEKQEISKLLKPEILKLR